MNAELHPQLHRVLAKFFRLWGYIPEAEAAERLASGLDSLPGQGTVVYKYLQRFTAILNQVFVLRADMWFDSVLKEALEITDFWLRYEFAKSRGIIHLHALLFKTDASLAIGQLLSDALKAARMQPTDVNNEAAMQAELARAERKLAQTLPATIASELAPLSALHPAGRAREHPELRPGQRAADREAEPMHEADRELPANGDEPELLHDDQQLPVDADERQPTNNWHARRCLVAEGRASASLRDHMVLGTDVDWTLVGNVDRWPAHEGFDELPPRCVVLISTTLNSCPLSSYKSSVFSQRCSAHEKFPSVEHCPGRARTRNWLGQPLSASQLLFLLSAQRRKWTVGVPLRVRSREQGCQGAVRWHAGAVCVRPQHLKTNRAASHVP